MREGVRGGDELKTTILSFCLLALFTADISAAELARPNILVILADDLGFSDLGCYGGEIATPHLDALATGGLRYTQFYNTARCWPTRAAILTGYYAQQVHFDELPGAGKSDRSRPKWSRLITEYLRPLGYRTYHSGKWHIDGKPVQSGFNRSYWTEDYNRNFAPQQHYLDDLPLPPVEPGTGYYSTTAIADRTIEFLQQHAAQHEKEPFFAYMAFICPHFPLHAPAGDIARYDGKYDLGWDEVRRARWQRIEKSLDLPGELSPREPKIGPPHNNPKARQELGPREVWNELAWAELTADQQAFQAAKMQVHAAMVDRMDQEIGRVVNQLRAMNALDNTVIFFLSDNGASAEIMIRGDGNDASASAGSAETFLCLGPGWSNAANTPFRRHKSWVHEGGIATPLIIHWPVGIATRGEVRQTVGHVIDLAPTIVHLAGGTWPADTNAPPSPGRDISPTFSTDAPLDRTLWWLHEGNRAVRKGNWKLVAARGEPWELYNLATDRAENRNLAAEDPEKVRELDQLWSEMAKQFEADAKRGAAVK